MPPRKPTTDPIVLAINTLLDAERNRLHVQTDEALADALGVDRLSIWRWRSGRIAKAVRILLHAALLHRNNKIVI